MTKDDLLLYLCKLTAQVPFSYDPNIYSIPHISRELNVSGYKIRKLMKELAADGLVKRAYDGGCDEDGYPHCYHGWRITRKVVDSELYKKCAEEAKAEFEKILQEIDKKWESENNG